jgi:hypothetical protein
MLEKMCSFRWYSNLRLWCIVINSMSSPSKIVANYVYFSVIYTPVDYTGLKLTFLGSVIIEIKFDDVT